MRLTMRSSLSALSAPLILVACTTSALARTADDVSRICGESLRIAGVDFTNIDYESILKSVSESKKTKDNNWNAKAVYDGLTATLGVKRSRSTTSKNVLEYSDQYKNLSSKASEIALKYWDQCISRLENGLESRVDYPDDRSVHISLTSKNSPPHIIRNFVIPDDVTCQTDRNDTKIWQSNVVTKDSTFNLSTAARNIYCRHKSGATSGQVRINVGNIGDAMLIDVPRRTLQLLPVRSGASAKMQQVAEQIRKGLGDCAVEYFILPSPHPRELRIEMEGRFVFGNSRVGAVAILNGKEVLAIDRDKAGMKDGKKVDVPDGTDVDVKTVSGVHSSEPHPLLEAFKGGYLRVEGGGNHPGRCLGVSAKVFEFPANN